MAVSKHLIECVARDDERLPPGIVASGERPLAGEALFERIEDFLKMCSVVYRRDGIVERLGLFVERQALAFEHADPSLERGQLAIQVLPPEPLHLVAGRAQGRQVGADAVRLPGDRVERYLGRLGLGLPHRRPVVGVDVVGVVLPHREDGLDVAFSQWIHRI